MVTFFLNMKTAEFLECKYYPEGHEDKKTGMIKIRIADNFVDLDPAEEDFKRITTAEELNKMRDSINRMRLEEGEKELTEDELPSATEDEEWYYYADHVIRRIFEDYNKGIIPENGTVAWY